VAASDRYPQEDTAVRSTAALIPAADDRAVLLALMARTAALDPRSLSQDMLLEALPLSHLDFMAMLAAVEEVCAVDLADADWASCKTLGELAERLIADHR